MKLDSRPLTIWSATLMLLVTALLIHQGQNVRPQHLQKPLGSLNLALGSWRAVGPERTLDVPTLKLLKPQDYLLRNYLDPHGRLCALFIAYFGLQQEGQIIHSPRHCLPGSGWHIESRKEVEVSVGKKKWRVNHLIITYDVNKLSVLYWYQGRGRVEANEYLDRLHLLIDGIFLQRTDAALIRLTSVLNPADPGTLTRQIKMAQALIPAMNGILPPAGPAR